MEILADGAGRTEQRLIAERPGISAKVDIKDCVVSVSIGEQAKSRSGVVCSEFDIYLCSVCKICQSRRVVKSTSIDINQGIGVAIGI